MENKKCKQCNNYYPVSLGCGECSQDGEFIEEENEACENFEVKQGGE